jgi:hypothetical protein
VLHTYSRMYTLIMVSHRYVPATASEKWLASLYALSGHILMDELGHQPCLTEPHPPALISASAAYHTRFSITVPVPFHYHIRSPTYIHMYAPVCAPDQSILPYSSHLRVEV